MTMKQFVADHVKAGKIDGVTADVLMHFHNAEVNHPNSIAWNAIRPILDEMRGFKTCEGKDLYFYHQGNTYRLSDFAERIDEALGMKASQWTNDSGATDKQTEK